MPSHMTLKKPARGTARKATRARRAAIERAERAAKDAAKDRDGGACRRCGEIEWPEAAHLVDKGMGGDHGLHSSHRRDFVTLCPNCHRGARSVHSGHVRLVYGPDMGDGPVQFVEAGDRPCMLGQPGACDCHGGPACALKRMAKRSARVSG